MKAEKLEAHLEGRERNSPEQGMSVSGYTAGLDHSCLRTNRLMEAVVEKKNMTQAYRRVMSNKGAAGIDKMAVEKIWSLI
ncbi:MAG TPA: hypothetical protein VKP65_23380 [Rhodothermales bacterium]|jgi:RNA-directed DNA polymerase|nr:hypothetical protein [Rhodothermales bacterium]